MPKAKPLAEMDWDELLAEQRAANRLNTRAGKQRVEKIEREQQRRILKNKYGDNVADSPYHNIGYSGRQTNRRR